MSENPNAFDETLLSGYLDGVLTQADEQRVRLKLEDDPEMALMLEQMVEVRDASLGTTFVDDGWDETPRSGASRALRAIGFLLLVAAAVLTLLMVFLESREPSAPLLLVRLLVAGWMGGIALVLLSVALDRMSLRRSDIYSKVKR